ncbi:tripartite motif-containing protein 45-like isoform X2 [Ceratina calcarata]|uniref:Tripartite motif-containing protein 45-like isoform X2 n=1 Tax=Ceratina calcarata TaxID=156304 RepID=A0AAJ7IUU5_9HYME|nr:tripartite motif-containing protein 45-like isoform X2 [Ceratina calcarata]
MDFIKCSKYQSMKNCCCEKSSMDDEHRSNENYTFPVQANIIDRVNPLVSIEPLRLVKNREHKKNSICESFEIPYGIPNHINNKNTREETAASFNAQGDKNFRCPRCGKRMQEPRLLPCLHPICSPCVSELMSSPCNNSSRNTKSNYYEVCPLCDFQLPNANSPIPPPHYPLQHRLVMNVVKSKFANKVLCDACSDEVVAVVQCSTCLRNFCLDCGTRHQQLVTMELKPSKHSVKPLWEATKVRRTAFCQRHPTHVLRFYCIACQQVTCKECIWSIEHRGHATENAFGAGKRVTAYLRKVLQRARTLLNMLLTQYDRSAFLNSTLENSRDSSSPMEYR